MGLHLGILSGNTLILRYSPTITLFGVSFALPCRGGELQYYSTNLNTYYQFDMVPMDCIEFLFTLFCVFINV